MKSRANVLNGTTPVSYTHLDVYKRQGNDNDQLIGISVGDNATLIMEGDAEISKSIKGQEVLVAPTGILQLKGGKIKAREEGTYGSERSLCLQAEMCIRDRNRCARLPDETIVPTYNEVVFACTVYLVHGRNHFI